MRLARPRHGEHGAQRPRPPKAAEKREKRTRTNIEPAELVVAALAGSWAAFEQLIGQVVRVRSEMELVSEQVYARARRCRLQPEATWVSEPRTESET